MRRVFLLLLVASPASGGSFNDSGKGSAAADFLKQGVGARAVAMGEAFCAVADDASALFWNPGALTRIEKRAATAMHASGINSSYFNYGSYAQNLGPYGAAGASFQYQSQDTITETDDATGQDVGTFRPHDLAFTIGYAYAYSGLSFGIAGKFIRSVIIDSAQTEAVDFGILSPTYLNEKLRLAFTATNLGGRLKFEQEPERLPFALRLGSAYQILERWSAALDVGFPNDNDPYVALGTEYTLPAGGDWNLTGRMGFNSRTIGDVTGITGFSFGVGFVYQKLSVDYGFVPFGAVGNIQRASVSARF